MDDKILPKIASKSSHNHHRLKRGWHKYTQPWLKYLGIMEQTILQNKDNIKKMSNKNLRNKCGVIKS
jgi:hypothetical protein